MKNRHFILAVIMLVFASLACGSSDTGVQVNESGSANDDGQADADVAEAGTSVSNPIAAGSEIVTGGSALLITSYERDVTNEVIAANTFNNEPETGQTYVKVNVSITCQNEDGCTYSPFEFKLASPQGNVFEPELVVTGLENVLSSGELLQGGSVSGDLYYIVPEDVELVLYYDPLSFFGDDVFIALPSVTE